MAARPVIPSRLSGGAPEHIRRNSSLSIDVLARLQALEGATSTDPAFGTFLGGYDQVADVATNTDSALLPATNYPAGDYYILTVNGVFSTSLPEINGQTGGAGDMLFSDGTQWVLFGISTNYLSSVADDTAQGVITFAQQPVSSLAASASNHLMRKGESDAGDANNASALASHEAQTTISNDVHGSRTYADNAVSSHDGLATAHGGHFQDASVHYPQTAIDHGVIQNRGTNTHAQIDAHIQDASIHFPQPSFGYLANGGISGAWNTTLKTITGYSDSDSTLDMTGQLNPSAGYIEIPAAGLWEIMATVVGDQGNDTKEEAMRLWLRVTNSANPLDVVLDVFDVATDKTSDRAFHFAFKRAFQPGERVSLGVNATSSMGTFSFEITSLEVTSVLT